MFKISLVILLALVQLQHVLCGPDELADIRNMLAQTKEKVTCARIGGVMRQCGKPCEKKCNGPTKSAGLVCLDCEPGCHCKRRFMRHDNGNCVPAKRC